MLAQGSAWDVSLHAHRENKPSAAAASVSKGFSCRRGPTNHTGHGERFPFILSFCGQSHQVVVSGARGYLGLSQALSTSRAGSIFSPKGCWVSLCLFQAPPAPDLCGSSRLQTPKDTQLVAAAWGVLSTPGQARWGPSG